MGKGKDDIGFLSLILTIVIGYRFFLIDGNFIENLSFEGEMAYSYSLGNEED
jgi:hypothetical protein